ncbi:MAG: hypothetical protein JST92_19335 [Deltaproteobacteria bacterium]|nr:hypothetical protein [Deltaproteobacteria bacterium]
MSSEEARQAVAQLGQHFVWLKSVWHNYTVLFENQRTFETRNATAFRFFDDLNRVMIEYLLLSFARITDPPRSMGNENFTIANLLETIDWPEPHKSSLLGLWAKLQAFRTKIVPARNKLIAHLDKNAFLKDLTLGVFEKGEDRVFIEDLEAICNVMHEAATGSIFGQVQVAERGDAIDLLRVLEWGRAFDRAISAAKGEEKMKLYDLIQPS